MKLGNVIKNNIDLIYNVKIIAINDYVRVNLNLRFVMDNLSIPVNFNTQLPILKLT